MTSSRRCNGQCDGRASNHHENVIVNVSTELHNTHGGITCCLQVSTGTTQELARNAKSQALLWTLRLSQINYEFKFITRCPCASSAGLKWKALKESVVACILQHVACYNSSLKETIPWFYKTTKFSKNTR